jgi:hypothetical protein
MTEKHPPVHMSIEYIDEQSSSFINNDNAESTNT